MNRRSQLIIGATLLALGGSVYALGLLDQESDVRYVSDIEEDPLGHSEGMFTLMGVAQPQTLHTTGMAGNREGPNPNYHNETVRVTAWSDATGTYHTTHRLHVDGPDAGGVSHWSLHNETRRPGRAELAFPPSISNWTLEGNHVVLQVQAFNEGQSPIPFIFAVYDGVLREPMQPKPSQFKGHVMTTLPDGTPIPDGAVVYWVEEYTAGCSSKFLPPEHEENQAKGRGNLTPAP